MECECIAYGSAVGAADITTTERITLASLANLVLQFMAEQTQACPKDKTVLRKLWRRVPKEPTHNSELGCKIVKALSPIWAAQATRRGAIPRLAPSSLIRMS